MGADHGVLVVQHAYWIGGHVYVCQGRGGEFGAGREGLRGFSSWKDILDQLVI